MTSTPRFPGKRAYQAPQTQHALIVYDLRNGQLVTLIGDVAARGPDAMDTSPASVLDIAAARALRDDLTAWLDVQPGSGTGPAESGASSRPIESGGEA